ncbi:MAG TPA: aminoglycoside adenylyltransferase domain-containing protein [Feifaniaceae bacterium]|nr:aminoglycoside adenylyltransferase domain-containing protein [Feifaniaceae bacterium]
MTDKLNKLLDDYANGVAEIFGDTLIGVYLTGSVVLDGFHEGKSDVDCTVLLRLPPGAHELEKLEKIHRKLAVRYRKIPIESQYITIDNIGREEAETELFYSFHDGKLALGTFNANPITWYTLKKYGKAVWGVSVEDLPVQTTIKDVTSYVRSNVRTYWTNWKRLAQVPFSLRRAYSLTDRAVEWCVCGITRMFYTCMEDDIASKDKALEYGIVRLPESTHKILKEALHIRNGKERKQYRSRFARRKGMIDYMGLLIKTIAELPVHVRAASSVAVE